jgi:hypothetical protein
MVTDKAGRNTQQVGLVRTRDGVLHVAWAESGVNPTLWHVGSTPGSLATWHTQVKPSTS